MSLSRSRLPFLLILIYLHETLNSPISDKQTSQKVVVVSTIFSPNNLQSSSQQTHSIVHPQSVPHNDKTNAQKLVIVPINFSPIALKTSSQQTQSIAHPQSIPLKDNQTTQKVVAAPTNFSPNSLQTNSPSIEQTHSIVHPQPVVLLDKVPTNTRKQKNHNILPVTHQLLLPAQLHVIPIHSNYHHDHAVHIIRNENLPILSHPISHTNNGTHSPLYLFPIHHTHLVPLHDLTVIPLQREIHTVDTKLAHYRAAMERQNSENEEAVNKFRSFYGGYGTGLFFGGHGAGHGFYTYG